GFSALCDGAASFAGPAIPCCIGGWDSATGVGAVFEMIGFKVANGSNRACMLTSGDTRGVWNAAAGSACNEFCELCALSFALPGIFGFFLSRLGCLGSFEGSVDCTGPIVGDLAKKFLADW